ncbi:collagen alpha-1(I) chain-like [Vidua chalybeata]|uniref:collagen alpha-1(I) chain-like n=1 Tax=Vidua chalybeata TaxID=81927 RepID=UPI0023A8D446|nr:collagen alpha-1(I) chain-like [Vidua chalybeata]
MVSGGPHRPGAERDTGGGRRAALCPPLAPHSIPARAAAPRPSHGAGAAGSCSAAGLGAGAPGVGNGNAEWPRSPQGDVGGNPAAGRAPLPSGRARREPRGGTGPAPLREIQAGTPRWDGPRSPQGDPGGNPAAGLAPLLSGRARREPRGGTGPAPLRESQAGPAALLSGLLSCPPPLAAEERPGVTPNSRAKLGLTGSNRVTSLIPSPEYPLISRPDDEQDCPSRKAPCRGKPSPCAQAGVSGRNRPPKCKSLWTPSASLENLVSFRWERVYPILSYPICSPESLGRKKSYHPHSSKKLKRVKHYAKSPGRFIHSYSKSKTCLGR